MERLLARLSALERKLEFHVRRYRDLAERVRELEQKLRSLVSK